MRLISRGLVILAWALPLLVTGVAQAADPNVLGEIEFYGYKGLDIAAIRSGLPFHEGDRFPPAKTKSSDQLKRQVSEAVRRVSGREVTDVSFVCCDSKQKWLVYIGLPGESYKALAFHPQPVAEVRLPKEAVALRERLEKAWGNAVMKGHATEDDSEGYALTDDFDARKAELAMREYALRNETLVLRTAAGSSDARHRAIAAQMIGYGRQSDEQIDALVHASLDVDEGVRNDAVRALAVLAGAKRDLAQRIPAEPFVRLLRSGRWTDHNKASMLLFALTKRRDPKLLEALRRDALDSLIEMARWRSPGHAEAALFILGRIAGLDDDAMSRMIEAGQQEKIIGRLNSQ